LKEQLTELSKIYRNIRVTFVVTEPPKSKDQIYLTGLINSQMIREKLPPPANDTWILVCGPPGFMNAISGNKTPDFKQGPLTGLLKEIGFKEDQVLKY
jgi:cytochrome-b5 reductase